MWNEVEPGQSSVEEVLSAFCILAIIITEHTLFKAVGSALLGYMGDNHSRQVF